MVFENHRNFLSENTNMPSTLRGGGRGVSQKWDVIGRTGVGGLASVLDVQSLFFY